MIIFIINKNKINSNMYRPKILKSNAKTEARAAKLPSGGPVHGPLGKTLGRFFVDCFGGLGAVLLIASVVWVLFLLVASLVFVCLMLGSCAVKGLPPEKPSLPCPKPQALAL